MKSSRRSALPLGEQLRARERGLRPRRTINRDPDAFQSEENSREGLTEECQKLVERVRNSNGKTVKTHCRGMYVLPEMVGSTIGVHDGQKFVNLEIIPPMIGHSLGEFAKTRKSVTHTGPGVGATRSSQHVALK